jgi:hypothetical protein
MPVEQLAGNPGTRLIMFTRVQLHRRRSLVTRAWDQLLTLNAGEFELAGLHACLYGDRSVSLGTLTVTYHWPT